MKDRATFLDACLGEKTEAYPDWAPSMTCRYCKRAIQPEDLELAASYWKITGQGPLWEPCHKACLQEGRSREAYECQCIDRDCNDCLYFIRNASNVGRDVFHGICQKTGSPTTGYPNFCSSMPCFVHRKEQELMAHG